MAFDISTARPEKSGFDISSARPEQLKASMPIDTPARPRRPAHEVPVTPEVPQERQAGLGIDEAILTMGSGALADIAGGVTGAVTGLLTQDPAAAEAVRAGVAERLTYQPRTEEGQETIQAVGEAVQPVGEALSAVEDTMGDFTFEVTGSPVLATAAKVTPTLLMEMLGLRALGGMKKGTRLIDAAGEPTKALRKALKKQGLEFENLTDTARAAIPDRVDPALLPAKTTVKGRAEDALIKQIKAGGTDSSLAPLKVVGGRVIPDKVAKEAVRQGFRPGTVQMAKASNRVTKDKMRKMVKDMRRIQADEGLDIRPTDVAGDALLDRAKYIKREAIKARDQLNVIANRDLKGLQIDPRPVIENLKKSFDDLRIKVTLDELGRPKINKKGFPELDFSDSALSVNAPAQKAINNGLELMFKRADDIDALRFHELKRELDDLIDFKKKSAEGLSERGRDVLKGIRGSINDSLRAAVPEYAKVNDKIHKSITALDNMQDAFGKKIDIFGSGGESAVGTRLRAVMSNQQGRQALNNTINQLDDLAASLGGKFDADVKRLSKFADALDTRFGATAKTSLRGDVEAARVAQDIKDPVSAVALRGIEKGAEKIRGINDFNAFNAIDELLK